MFIACVIALLAGMRADASPTCKHCTLDVPRTHDGDVPLLVVLHGDREHAAAAAARWRTAAQKRGWAVLALECPVDQAARTAGGDGTAIRAGSSSKSMRS